MDARRAAAPIDRRTLLQRGGIVLGGVTGASVFARGAATAAAGEHATHAPTTQVVVGTFTSAAIQAAIDALPATGGIVQLVAGTYVVTNTLTVPDNCQIAGAGQGVTILQLGAGANTTVLTNVDAVNGNVRVAIRGLTVDGNRAQQDATTNHQGIEVHKCAALRLDDVEVSNCAGHGILVSGDGTVTRVAQLSNVYAHHNALSGVYVSWAMREITYTAVTADANGQDGVIIDHSEAVVTGMECSRNGRDGLRITNVVADNLTGITANLNGRYGIYVMGFVNSVGAAWCAHDNGQTQPASDVYFTSVTSTYGLTDHAIVHGIECGPLLKSTWGPGYPNPPKPTETFGLTIDPAVIGNVTLIGVRNTGGKSGAYSIPPAANSGRLVIVDHPENSSQLRVLRGGLAVTAGDLVHGSPSARVGFYGAAPTTKPVVTGAKGGNAALTSIVHALAALGLVTDSTT